MSSITWSGMKLVQTLGHDSEELGVVRLDDTSSRHVLWLKDTCGVLDLDGSYIRADEYQSLDDAKNNAALSSSAFIMHYIWIRRIAKLRTMEALDEHWDDIAAAIPYGINRDAVRDRVSKYLDRLPIDQIKQWGTRIRDGVIVSALVELIRSFLGG